MKKKIIIGICIVIVALGLFFIVRPLFSGKIIYTNPETGEQTGLFSYLYYDICLDENCEEYRDWNIFELADSQVYVKAFETEDATLTGTLTLPDNTTQSLSFVNNVSIVSLTQLGDYQVEVKAKKEGYIDAEDYFLFEVVDNVPEKLDISYSACSDAGCLVRKTLFEDGGTAYIKAYDVDGASLIGNLTLPDNSSVVLNFVSDIAEISLNQLGEHFVEIQAEKAGYENYTYYVQFWVLDELLPIFENIYYLTCSDSQCTRRKETFELDDVVYIKTFETEEASLIGNLTLPDNSSVVLSFVNDVAEISLSQTGEYKAEITAYKQGYLNYTRDVEFYASVESSGVIQNYSVFENLSYEACSTVSNECYESGSLLELDDFPIYVRANEREGGSLNATLIFPDNSTQDLFVNYINYDFAATAIPTIGIGKYYIEITASKENYIDYAEVFEFRVVDEVPDVDAISFPRDLKGKVLIGPLGKDQTSNLNAEVLYDNDKLYIKNTVSSSDGSFTLYDLPEGRILDITLKPKYYLRKNFDFAYWEFNEQNNFYDFGSMYSEKCDLNDDNWLNFFDIGPFSGCYGSNVTLNPECKKADLTFDGKVDFFDIGSFGAAISSNRQGDASLTTLSGVIITGAVVGEGIEREKNIALLVVLGLIVAFVVVLLVRRVRK